jgi:hypothetical protein
VVLMETYLTIGVITEVADDGKHDHDALLNRISNDA